MDLEIREENKKRTMKIGEILEFIFLTFFIFTPLWRIPTFIDMYKHNENLILEIAKSVLLTIVSIFLMYQLNPLEIKNKILNNNKKDVNNENKE